MFLNFFPCVYFTCENIVLKKRDWFIVILGYVKILSTDRFVATGQFASSVVTGSVKVYRFDEVMNLNKTEVRYR